MSIVNQSDKRHYVAIEDPAADVENRLRETGAVVTADRQFQTEQTSSAQPQPPFAHSGRTSSPHCRA